MTGKCSQLPKVTASVPRSKHRKGTVEMTQCARVLAAWYPQKKPGLASHGTKDGDRRIVEAGRPLTKLQGW